MALRIVIRPRAVRELTRLATYLARQARPALGRRFLKAVASTVARIARMPASGSLVELENPRLLGIRVCAVKRFENYLISYRVTGELLEVLHLLHGARDVEGLLEDLE
jgi:plasmid stabilization system protein ParE